MNPLSRTFICRFSIVVIGVFLSFNVSAGENRVPQPEVRQLTEPFKDGANCLFIGHNFYIPVARYFHRVASQNKFSAHQASLVFSPGKSGSPAELWNNPKRKKQIETTLANGKVDLLGMTVFSDRNSSFQHFKQWIDLALKYNPKTRFFIGQCWVPGGPKMDTQRYDAAINASGERIFKIVAKLRETYPKNHIYFINYGKIASVLKDHYGRNKLPDITKMVGRDQQALFRDGLMGHGGPMILELSSLVWLEMIYGAEIEKLNHTPYKADVKDIVAKVVKFNQKYK